MVPPSRAAAEEALEQAERALDEGEVDSAAELIGEAARLLLETADEPGLLGRASWLAAMVSLSSGDIDAFIEQSEQAIAMLAEAGADEQAAAARWARAELAGRILEVARVGASGSAALAAIFVDDARRMLEAARATWDISFEDAPELAAAWAPVLRDRSRTAGLLDAARAHAGRPSPVARLVHAFALDEIDRDLVLALFALASEPALARAFAELSGESSGEPPALDLLCRAAFPPGEPREAARARLAPGASLLANGIVVVTQSQRQAAGAPERVAMDPDVLAFLAGAVVASRRFGALLLARGPADAPARLDSPVAAAAARASQLLAAPTRAPRLVLVGPRGAGKRTAIRAAARAMGRQVVEVEAALVDAVELDDILAAGLRDARLLDAVLYVDLRDRLVRDKAGTLAERVVSRLTGVSHPVALGVRAPSQALALAAPWAVELAIEPVPLREQLGLWAEALVEAGAVAPAPEVIHQAACREGLTPGQLRACAHLAFARARADDPQARGPSADHLREAVQGVATSPARQGA